MSRSRVAQAINRLGMDLAYRKVANHMAKKYETRLKALYVEQREARREREKKLQFPDVAKRSTSFHLGNVRTKKLSGYDSPTADLIITFKPMTPEEILVAMDVLLENLQPYLDEPKPKAEFECPTCEDCGEVVQGSSGEVTPCPACRSEAFKRLHTPRYA